MKKFLCMILCATMMCGSVISVYAEEKEPEVNVEVKFPWAPNKDSTDILKAFSIVTQHYEPNISDIPITEDTKEEEPEVHVPVKFPWAPNRDSTNILKSLYKVTHYEPNISEQIIK